MEAFRDLTPDDTNVPDIHSGALDVAGHVLGTLGVQALSGIKGLSTLPQGTDAATKAISDYQNKYSPKDLSPEGIDTIRNTVAPIYRGVQDTFHTKALADAYNQGAQSFSDLVGKYLGPEAAGVAGVVADTAPMMITPEGLLGKSAANTAKLIPKLTPLLDDGATTGTLSREAAANSRRAEDGLPVGDVPPSEFQGRQAEHEGAVAQRMVPSRQISAVPGNESHLAGSVPDDATVYTSTDPETGDIQGYAATVPRSGAHQMFNIEVDPEYQRQGIGRDLFNSAVAGAHGEGLPFHGDTSVTPEQMANIQHSGHTVTFNPHVEETTDSTGMPVLKSRNGQPVYTIQPPAAADDALEDEPQQGSWVSNQAYAEGGEVGTALGDIGKLVDQFAPLTKQIQETGGVTYHPGTGAQPTSGYAVSLHKGRESVLPNAPTDMDLAKYTYANRDAFELDPGAHVGVWKDPESGQHFMDVSHVDPDFQSALQKAKDNAQLGIFDLGRGETIPTDDSTLHFLHMSNLSQPDVTLDPKFYGTGIKGAEAKRGGAKVTSLYPAAIDPSQIEQDLESKTPYRVSMPASSMYNANEDPLALKDVNRLPSGNLDMNGYEDAIRDAGYAGYHVPDATGILKGQGRLFGPTPATRLGPGLVPKPEEDLSQGFAEGGEISPVLGDLGSLVSRYAPEAEHLANVVADTGGVTYNPTSGDMPTHGYAVPTQPERSAALDHPPTADDIHDYMMTHQDAFDEDPQAALHVHSDDNGNHFIHVAHVTPDFGAASDVAAQHSLPGFQDLQSKEIFPANHDAATADVPTNTEPPDSDLVQRYLSGSASVPTPWTPGQQTVANPKRNAFPGIYNDPRQVIADADSKVGPEDPLLQ